MVVTLEQRDAHIKATMERMAARPDQRVPVDEDLLTALLWAQARHTAELLASPYNRFGDDWGDDTNAALDLMRVLFDMAWDQCDLQALDVWLNTPQDNSVETIEYAAYDSPDAPTLTLPTLANIGGCDGYAPELYELDCPALPKERD